MTSGGAVDDGSTTADRLLVRTWSRPAWSASDLLEAKGARSVSVVFPARDHAEVIEDAVHAVEPYVGVLVDEIVVVDAGSTDATVTRAHASGARVEGCTARDGGSRAGRGEAIWRALEVTGGDVVVVADPCLDAPLHALLGPLLVDERVALVKGYRELPSSPSESRDVGGGRLTELLIRPLLASLWPELTGIVAPLGREFAATRALLAAVPIAPGPSADIGILLDALSTRGVEAIAQVSVGVSEDVDAALSELGPIGRQIVATIMDRFGVVDSGAPLTSFRAVDGGFEARQATVTLRDLPPLWASDLAVT